MNEKTRVGQSTAEIAFARMSAPASSARTNLAEMARAVDTKVIQDIVRDNRAPPTPPPSSPTPGGNGWVDPLPLAATPPGYQHIERMMDAEDANWRAQRRKDFEK